MQYSAVAGRLLEPQIIFKACAGVVRQLDLRTHQARMSSATLGPSQPKVEQYEIGVSRAMSDRLDRTDRLLTGSSCRPSNGAAAGPFQRPNDEQRAVDTVQRGVPARRSYVRKTMLPAHDHVLKGGRR